MKAISGIIALLSFLACLVLPVLHFLGALDLSSFRNLLAVASVCWFVAATSWEGRRKK